MTALDQLAYTMRMLTKDCDDIGRAEAEKQCREAEQEQAELRTLISRLVDGLKLCGGQYQQLANDNNVMGWPAMIEECRCLCQEAESLAK